MNEVGFIKSKDGKIFKVKELLREEILINEDLEVNGKNPSLYLVIWFNNGTFEKRKIHNVGTFTHALGLESRIPFNPLNHGFNYDNEW